MDARQQQEELRAEADAQAERSYRRGAHQTAHFVAQELEKVQTLSDARTFVAALVDELHTLRYQRSPVGMLLCNPAIERIRPERPA